MFWAAVSALTFHFLAAVAARSTPIANVQSRSLELIDYPRFVAPGETYPIVFNGSDGTTTIVYLVEGPRTSVVVVAEIGTTNNQSDFYWTVAKDLKPADDYYLKIVQREATNYSGPVSIEAPTNTTTTASGPTSSTPSPSTSASAANTPAPNNKSSSQSINKLAIGLGAGLGVSVLIIGLVVVGLLLRRHTKAKRKERKTSEKPAYYDGKPEIDGTAIEKEGFVYELNGEPEKRELHGEANCLELETQHAELEASERAEMEGDLKPKDSR